MVPAFCLGLWRFMHGVWKKLCPQFVHALKGFDKAVVSKPWWCWEVRHKRTWRRRILSHYLRQTSSHWWRGVDWTSWTAVPGRGAGTELWCLIISKIQQAFAHIEKGLAILDGSQYWMHCKNFEGCHVFAPYRIIFNGEKSKKIQDTLEHSHSASKMNKDSLNPMMRRFSHQQQFQCSFILFLQLPPPAQWTHQCYLPFFFFFALA